MMMLIMMVMKMNRKITYINNGVVNPGGNNAEPKMVVAVANDKW